MLTLLKKIFGSKNEREIKRMHERVARINAFEAGLEKLSDGDLAAKSGEFRQRISQGASLDEILEEAFAVVREASKRALLMRHYDVQLIGGMVLHEGKIAEMRTGEGKTLVASLPVYLNALSGLGVHVITVNDYLAERDSLGKGSFRGMGEIYRLLGLSVGCILHGQSPIERRAAYECDITYGTNNEFGFDYLRDNMVRHPAHRVQRPLNFALVDEVDSILIDEARTPLIISGPAEESTDQYGKADQFIRNSSLKKDIHYTLDEKARAASLSDEGVTAAEKYLGIDNLYDPRNTHWVHYVNQALRAHVLYRQDVDYVVKDGKVTIVDEFTGRLMPGRRWSEGLHQAVEAKSGVMIERENQTLATITLQNYFRMYSKLAGMTGTADTEAAEFHEIYKLAVVVIPTHRPMVRHDASDLVYKSVKGKFKAVADDIAECYKLGQPVLVGTVSIERNEQLSDLLKRLGVTHEVLNAKNHAREAEIIAQAGQKGSVTIATNMAGRGTDIVLGSGVKELGGLKVIGTERNESRRVDLQLRGRSGRQGDAGSSRFYVSLEDDLMRIFGSDRIQGLMSRLGMTEDEAIEHSIITKSIERAQKSVEAHHFDVRKHLLEYDNVMNRQREVIYSRRLALLEGEDVRKDVLDMLYDLVEDHFRLHALEGVVPEEWDLRDFSVWFEETFRVVPQLPEKHGWAKMGMDDVVRSLLAQAEQAYLAQEIRVGVVAMRAIERHVVLEAVDGLWKDHLLSMDRLKEGIGLRAYGQKDPLIEYKREGFEMFARMMGAIKEQVVPLLMRVDKAVPEQELLEEVEEVDFRRLRESRPEFNVPGMAPEPEAAPNVAADRPKVQVQPIKRDFPKVGRNELCPCGSGKKYKHCHGQI